MIEPIMSLDLPVVGETVSPQWANMFIEALLAVAEHDHTAGSGVKLTPNALSFTQDLAINSKNLTTARSVRFISNVSTLEEVTDLNVLFVVAGNLYYKNNLGQNIKLTEGAAINLATVGTIGGDYGQAGVDATAIYSDLTKTFSFLRESGIAANIVASQLVISHPTTGSQAVTFATESDSLAHTITLPKDYPNVADSVLKFSAIGKAVYERNGQIPLGCVLASFPNLTGAHNCTATTAADDYGFVVCEGQTIADARSPMNGDVVPHLNDDVFLMGHATSGSSGGANTKDLSHNHTTDSKLGSIDLSHTHSVTDHTHNLSQNGGALINENYDSPARRLWVDQGGPSSDYGRGQGVATAYYLPTGYNVGYPGTRATVALAGRTDGITTAVSTGAKSGSASYDATHTHSTNSSGMSSTFDIKPKYITTRYIMRIV